MGKVFGDILEYATKNALFHPYNAEKKKLVSLAVLKTWSTYMQESPSAVFQLLGDF